MKGQCSGIFSRKDCTNWCPPPLTCALRPDRPVVCSWAYVASRDLLEMVSLADRAEGCLWGLLIGDALAMPVHWFYNTENIKREYGEVTDYVDPKPTHCESMISGMQCPGAFDIAHDKKHLWEGTTVLPGSPTATEAELRDEHGNFVGRRAEERPHYHGFLMRGQNTVNMCLARKLMVLIADKNGQVHRPYTHPWHAPPPPPALFSKGISDLDRKRQSQNRYGTGHCLYCMAQTSLSGTPSCVSLPVHQDTRMQPASHRGKCTVGPFLV